MPQKYVEIAVDPLGGDSQRGHSKSGNVHGRLIEQQGLLDSEADLDFPFPGLFQFLVYCLELGGSCNDALLQVGVESAYFGFRALALGDVLNRAESLDRIAVFGEFDLSPFSNPFHFATNNDPELDVITCPM